MIATQGHQLSVFPRFTAQDPNLVAFDPTAVPEGVLTSFKIADTIAKRKAFLAAQAELAATQDARIGATNATNNATIGVAPQKALADIARYQGEAALAPSDTKLGLQRNKGALSDLAFNETVRPDVEYAKAIEDAGRADNAKAKAALESMNTANDLEANPLKHALELKDTKMKLDNIVNDKELSDKEKVAKIAEIAAQTEQAKASAENLYANADFTNRNRPKAGADGEETIDELQKQLGHVETSIKRLEDGKAPNPTDSKAKPVSLLDYKGQTHEMNGDVRNVDKWFQSMRSVEKVPVDKEAENSLAQLNDYYKLRDSINQKIITKIAGGSGAYSPKTPADLISDVKAGKISAADAKAYATKQGWK